MTHPKEGSLLIVAGLDAPSSDGLGLGELVRVLLMAQDLAASHIDWCSPARFFPLAQQFPAIASVKSVEQLATILDHYERVLNVCLMPLPPTSAHVIQVADILAGKQEIKRRTYPFPDLLRSHMGLAPDARISIPNQPPPNPKYDVGFNWHIPDIWRIKALPESHWKQIEAALPSHLTISWQPPNSNVADFIDWVGSCRLLLSCVGFGCHLAMMHGIGLVILSGPTDFIESSRYDRGTVLYPPSLCEHRPCFLFAGKECNGCMADFQPEQVVQAVLKYLP